MLTAVCARLYSPAFTKLEAALENFGRKAPAQLVALLEPEAFLCPSLVATSVIILHERFCTSEHNDPSMIKCLEAANSILQNMQVLNSASSSFKGMNSHDEQILM